MERSNESDEKKEILLDSKIHLKIQFLTSNLKSKIQTLSFEFTALPSAQNINNFIVYAMILERLNDNGNDKSFFT